MGTPEDIWPIFGRHLVRDRDPGLAVEVDEPITWTRGATAEDLARIGQAQGSAW